MNFGLEKFIYGSFLVYFHDILGDGDVSNNNNYCGITSLWQVRAAYRYVAEDDDELSFEKGEIINVIEFEDPDEQVGKNH